MADFCTRCAEGLGFRPDLTIETLNIKDGQIYSVLCEGCGRIFVCNEDGKEVIYRSDKEGYDGIPQIKIDQERMIKTKMDFAIFDPSRKFGVRGVTIPVYIVAQNPDSPEWQAYLELIKRQAISRRTMSMEKSVDYSNEKNDGSENIQ